MTQICSNTPNTLVSIVHEIIQRIYTVIQDCIKHVASIYVGLTQKLDILFELNILNIYIYYRLYLLSKCLHNAISWVCHVKITQGIYFVKYRVIFEIITIDTFLVY